MNVWLFAVLTGAGSLLAGFLGALTGLGGGVVLIPMLTLVFGVDIRYAIGASLISVIATSSGAAAVFVREGYSNVRIGMLLEVATSAGAITGALLAGTLHTSAIGFVFGVVLLHSAYQSFRDPKVPVTASFQETKLALKFRLHGTYPSLTGPRAYTAQSLPLGFGLMGCAGVLSGLLGIGSGALKVLAMDRVMRLPFKVSTATSNFMIGVTAAASSGVYLSRGYIDPGLSMPVMLGVLAGSMLGARFLAVMPTRTVRRVFAVVILLLAIQMLYNSLTGGF